MLLSVAMRRPSRGFLGGGGIFLVGHEAKRFVAKEKLVDVSGSYESYSREYSYGSYCTSVNRISILLFLSANGRCSEDTFLRVSPTVVAATASTSSPGADCPSSI